MTAGGLIHHVAWASNGSRVALGSFEKTVAVWDMVSSSAVATFETILDFGGKRLAFSSDGSILVAAAYEQLGTAAYDANNGTVLWCRPDLHEVQYLTASSHERHFYACRERGTTQKIDFLTGQTIADIGDVDCIWSSLYSTNFLLDVRNNLSVVDENFSVKFSKLCESFSVTSAAFSVDAVLFSAAGAGVSCVCLETGATRWHSKPKPGNHFVELAFANNLKKFVGVMWSFQNGGSKILVHFGNNGEIQAISELGDITVACFNPSADFLLTGDKRLVSVADGSSRSFF